MGKMENDHIKKILNALGQAKSLAPLGYISLHTGIKEPLKTLKMGDRGLVSKKTMFKLASRMEPTLELLLSAKEESVNAVIVGV